jgi:hypothetical protein
VTETLQTIVAMNPERSAHSLVAQGARVLWVRDLEAFLREPLGSPNEREGGSEDLCTSRNSAN